MSHYLIQVAYTPEAWATMVKSPQDRMAAIAPAVERLGGKVKDGYLSFGDYDTIAICEFPDDVERRHSRSQYPPVEHARASKLRRS